MLAFPGPRSRFSSGGGGGGKLTPPRKREPTRGVRGHAPLGKFEILGGFTLEPVSII